jgi:hypothetical protein
MGLLVLAYMSGGSMPKTLAMAALGLFLGTIGIDQMSGFFRFQYGIIRAGRRHRRGAGGGRTARVSEVCWWPAAALHPASSPPRLSELLPSPPRSPAVDRADVRGTRSAS